MGLFKKENPFVAWTKALDEGGITYLKTFAKWVMHALDDKFKDITEKINHLTTVFGSSEYRAVKLKQEITELRQENDELKTVVEEFKKSFMEQEEFLSKLAERVELHDAALSRKPKNKLPVLSTGQPEPVLMIETDPATPSPELVVKREGIEEVSKRLIQAVEEERLFFRGIKTIVSGLSQLVVKEDMDEQQAIKELKRTREAFYEFRGLIVKILQQQGEFPCPTKIINELAWEALRCSRLSHDENIVKRCKELKAEFEAKIKEEEQTVGIIDEELVKSEKLVRSLRSLFVIETTSVEVPKAEEVETKTIPIVPQEKNPQSRSPKSGSLRKKRKPSQLKTAVESEEKSPEEVIKELTPREPKETSAEEIEEILPKDEVDINATTKNVVTSSTHEEIMSGDDEAINAGTNGFEKKRQIKDRLGEMEMQDLLELAKAQGVTTNDKNRLTIEAQLLEKLSK